MKAASENLQYTAAMFVVVSGLSGAGKNTALRALEDRGFWVTDNLPPALWRSLLELAQAQGVTQLAVGTDSRTRLFLEPYHECFSELRSLAAVRGLFLEADDETLLRRYNLTRRDHPLGDSLMLDFQRERSLLAPVRALADVVIDTTTLTASELVKRVSEAFELEHPFDLRLLSFGFKHAPPRDADLVLDVRSMPNPFYDPKLRELSGHDPNVAAYVFSGEGEAFYAQLRDYLRFSIQAAQRSGRHTYNVAVGCTGGQHRSVAVVQRLLRDLGEFSPRLIDHRDVSYAAT